MNHYDHDLKVYADSGFRTAEDWLTQRRKVVSGTNPCASTAHRGVAVALYNRAQTLPSGKPHQVRLSEGK